MKRRRSTGSAEHDLRAALEFLGLPFKGGSAVDGDGVHAAFADGQFVDFAGDLGREFAGGAKDEDLDGRKRGVGLLDGGNGEGGGFSGAGLGLPDDITSGEQHGNGGGLDGGSFLEAEFVYCFENLRREAEAGKSVSFHLVNVAWGGAGVTGCSRGKKMSSGIFRRVSLRVAPVRCECSAQNGDGNIGIHLIVDCHGRDACATSPAGGRRSRFGRCGPSFACGVSRWALG